MVILNTKDVNTKRLGNSFVKTYTAPNDADIINLKTFAFILTVWEVI
jgi:hypothetical protein